MQPVSAGTGWLAIGKAVSKPVVDKLIVGGGVDDYYKTTAGPAISKLFISGQQ